MAYNYRIKAVGSSHYAKSFDEVKEAVLTYISKNNCGEIYEKIAGIDVMVWKFEPYTGMVRVRPLEF